MQKKILIVDDDADIRRSLQLCLENEGYAVSTAASAREGIEAAAAQCPDLVLMDVTMPEMSGLEATRAMKQDAAINHIPIVILSARTEYHDMEKGWDAGTDLYLEKPISPAKLTDLVQCILEG